MPAPPRLEAARLEVIVAVRGRRGRRGGGGRRKANDGRWSGRRVDRERCEWLLRGRRHRPRSARAPALCVARRLHRKAVETLFQQWRDATELTELVGEVFEETNGRLGARCLARREERRTFGREGCAKAAVIVAGEATRRRDVVVVALKVEVFGKIDGWRLWWRGVLGRRYQLRYFRLEPASVRQLLLSCSGSGLLWPSLFCFERKPASKWIFSPAVAGAPKNPAPKGEGRTQRGSSTSARRAWSPKCADLLKLALYLMKHMVGRHPLPRSALNLASRRLV